MSDPLQPSAGGREREVFLGALEATGAAERAAFLERACAHDPALRRSVEVLLREQARIGGFLETPAIERTPDGPGTRPTAAETDLPGLAVTEQAGDRIGRYRLREKIGEGGAGVVYLAEQEEPVRRRVALKVIKLGMDTRSVVARFEAERQALALMDHPNIATVLDAGATDAGRPYFVMELVRGVRITAYFDQNHLPARERLALFIEVCQAIQHAHQKGIIHRDIKPSNILVTLHDGTPVPKVIDFGIAKATEHRLTEKTLVTAFTAFIGTPAYMSPEQAEMSGLDIDTRSDVYSLGVLLYELLSGRTPFDPATLVQSGLDECRRTIREVEPPRPSTCLETMVASELTTTARQRRVEAPQLIHLLRGDLDWVVMKCLEKDRRRRYQTANELALDVQRYLANEPVLARPPSRSYRFEKFVRRHRGVLAAATGMALTLVGGAGVSVWQAVRATRAERDAVTAQGHEARLRQEAERQRATARLNEYVADINLAQQALVAGNFGRAIQLVAKHQPVPGEPDLRGFEWRYLWQLAQGDAHVAFPDQPESVQGLALSPDGQLLAIGTSGALSVWNVRTKTVVHRASRGAVSVAFLPNGTHLLTADPGAVRIWNVAGWTERHVLPGNGAPFALSPNGARLAATTRGGVTVWSTADWAELRTLQGAVGPMAFSPDGRTLATNGRDGITLWSLETGAVRSRLTDSANLFRLGGWWFGGGSLMAFSPDGRSLVAPRFEASKRGTFVLSVWDATSGDEVAVLPEDPDRVEHAGIITGVAFAPDGRTLATGSMDHSIRLWDFATRRRTATLQGHLNEVWAIAVSADGETLASGAKDGGVKLWATQRSSSADLLSGPLRPLAFSPDSRTLAVLLRDDTVAFLDWATGETKREFLLEGGRFRFRPAVSFSADLGTLAQGLGDGTVKLWSTTDRTARVVQAGHGPVDLVALSPDARSLVTGGRDQPLRWWDLHTLTNSALEVTAMQVLFSPDGGTLAIFERGSSIQLRNAATHALRARIRPDAELAPTIAFSNDGARLATSGAAGGANHILQVWDTATGRLLGDYRGHKQGIRAVAFSPDGRTLASSSDDSTLKLWNVATQQELLSFQRLGGRPTDLLFSPDGRVLVGAAPLSPGTAGLLFHRAPAFGVIAAAVAEQMERNRNRAQASQGLVRP